MKNLRIIVGVIAVALLLAAGAYAAYWFVMAGQLRAGLENWAAARRAEGYDIKWGAATVDGFPTTFRVALADASLARGNSYRIASPAIAGAAVPWNLARWQVSAAGGATGSAQGIDSPITAQSLTGEVVLGAEDNRFDLSALNLAGAGATIGTVAVQATLPRHPPQSHRDLGLAATVQLFHLVLPRPVKALGETIESFALQFHVMGGLPPGDWRQALASWRDEGGTVELTRGTMQWGALELELSGTAALDAAMQPMAAMTGSIINQDALIDAAVGARMLPKNNAILVKLVLDLLARRDADGRTRLTAPVTVRDGKLAIGKAEIGKVPPIEWR